MRVVMDQHLSFNIDVDALRTLREEGAPHSILDVREPWEVAVCALPDSLHVPITSLPGQLDRLPRDRPLVVVCHHGIRSFKVTAWLHQLGFTNAVNLEGGIDAWAKRIDPAMPTY